MAVCHLCAALVDHAGHALENIEDEAERLKIEMKSMIETLHRDVIYKQSRLLLVNLMKTTRRSNNEAKR